ncbi:MAG: hypothetical protein Q8O52_04905 [Sulfuritalea sp.]|nr:hypothetical protein [Sulfuritalea sp.]
MKKSLSVFAMCAALSASANAQEKAELVQTTGFGDLKRASEALIAPKNPSISIRLPTTVKKGEIISIQYDNAGSVADSFMVTGITIQDGSCSIESKRATPTGSLPADMIYARSCKKLK